ncbi:hypothetical protein BPTFM16_01110 [Altererythrobacter insulae]|nr:hypothetical protein BPTFM16_01110 [Altererythrobacter insulae]
MNELPDGLESFLENASWEEAVIDTIPGDASFRRYFRIRKDTRTAMLMYAPPPEEDPQPFVKVAEWLSANGMRAPKLLARDLAAGWLLTEDFGNDRMREWVEANPDRETAIYEQAIDALVKLHKRDAGPFAFYDQAVYQREAALLTEWYCPAAGLDVDTTGYFDAWSEVLPPIISRQSVGVTVLRDYHAENIMILGDCGETENQQGLIDFQDALVGHRAYDLVSLLQDARRDVAPELERQMLERYIAAAAPGPEFEADYAVLGAQRNAKIVGIFTRLFKRDGKPRYLDYIPRVWALMERDLADPALAPVAAWFDANIPSNLRKNGGGEIA